MNKLETTFKREMDNENKTVNITEYLKVLKEKYPASDTILLIPEESVCYNEIINTMDCARMNNELDLFPNVVLAASLG